MAPLSIYLSNLWFIKSVDIRSLLNYPWSLCTYKVLHFLSSISFSFIILYFHSLFFSFIHYSFLSFLYSPHYCSSLYFLYSLIHNPYDVGQKSARFSLFYATACSFLSYIPPPAKQKNNTFFCSLRIKSAIIVLLHYQCFVFFYWVLANRHYLRVSCYLLQCESSSSTISWM